MSAITFRLTDNKHDRIKALAKNQQISVNKLLDELTTIALVSFDAKTRFDARASKCDIKRGIELLNKL
jgi:predicted HicB family RNase H-like nuclease